MPVKMLSRCDVMHNGTKVEYLKNYTNLEEEYRKEVALMSGVGSIDVVQKHKFSLDYVLPKKGAKLDWSDIEDATFVIRLGDKSITYSGVDCLSAGEFKLDGENEAVRTITFLATSKDVS